jgi:hypothetical protein
MDLGAFHQEGMPLRTFLSLKTTVKSTELYSEGLLALDVYDPPGMSGAVSLGFSQDFFDGKFTANAEIFYNAEKGTRWYRPETTLREEETPLFIDGLNGALNLRYRFGGKGNPRAFVQTRYAPQQDSGQLVPGFTLNPWPHIELYFAVPMALGSKDGHYYKNTVRMDTRETPHRPLPFGVMLLVTLRGGIQLAHYY